MPRFRHAQATHPDWRVAVELVDAQLEAQARQSRFVDKGTLGILYAGGRLSERYESIRDALARRIPGLQWAGAGVEGVLATGVEHPDAPALALMICELPASDFRIFPASASLIGTEVEGMPVESALVHAEPDTRELAALLDRLSRRTRGARLFGGVIGSGSGSGAPRGEQPAAGAIHDGVSGVAFGPRVGLLSRITQGCAPLAGEHLVSSCQSHYIHTLDGRPALDVMLDDLGVSAPARASRDGEEILRALPAGRLARGLMIGFAPAGTPRGFGFGDYLVRNVVGIDPANRLLAVAAQPREGERAVFCTRDCDAARADLIRVCTELREETETGSLRILGAHYVSCVGRGANLFGAPGAETAIIRHNLGEIPLVGFFAHGEIAGNRLYGYTGVLTLFVAPHASGRPN